MNIDLAALPDDVETLQRLVRSLAAERTALTEAQAEIERLHLIIKKLQRNQFGRRAERLDDGQFQLGFEDLGADIGRVEATLPLAATKTPRSRLLIDRPRMPAHLPREEMQLDIGHQACPCCGGELHRIGETVSEMLDHVPARLRVIRNLPAALWVPSLRHHSSGPCPRAPDRQGSRDPCPARSCSCLQIL